MFLLIALYFFYLTKKESYNPQKSSPSPLTNLIANEDRNIILDVCYKKETYNRKSGSYDQYELNVYAVGVDVEGELRIMPADKTYKSGSFYGNIGYIGSKHYIDAWWDAYTDFTNTKEELRIQINNDGTASIGMGSMINNGDGTFFYRNKDRLDYDLTLKEVECN